MNKLIVDYGTSSCRASLVDENGRITGSCRKSVSFISSGNVAEINPEDAWKTVLSVIRNLIETNSNPGIDAVGVSSLLGWVFLDSVNKPIGNSIIWMDTREERDFEMSLTEDIPDFHQRTGRKLSNELLISKWVWLKRNSPDICKQTSKIISFKDELVRRLTGNIISDYAHLNYTMFWNIKNHKLDPDMLKLAEFPSTLLPEAAYPYEQAGSINPETAGFTGLVEGTPVIIGSIDGTTAMYGGGMATEGNAVLVSGTSDVLMYLTDTDGADRVCKDSTLTLNTGFIPGFFAAGGSTGLSGGALKKMVELFGDEYSSLLERAGMLPPGAEGLIFNPGFSGERAPYWNSTVSGSLIGLKINHQREHMIRALMEGTAFRLKRLYIELFSRIPLPENLNITGGNAGIDSWNSIKADVLGIDLIRLSELEGTTLGTALFCDSFSSGGNNLGELSKVIIRTEKIFKADKVKNEIYCQFFECYEDFLKDSMDIFIKLEKLRGY